MSQGQGDAAFCAQGILLYYHYTDLKDQQQETAQWMQELCQSLGLRGRVRVARDGVSGSKNLILLRTKHARVVHRPPSCMPQ
eukprot:scaffold30628_cov21-Tisochrysis_lutea.AAC.1